MIIGKCPVCGGDMIVGSDMTNADRIRSMTDEELANWLTIMSSSRPQTSVQWLEWLKQEEK